MKVLVIVAHPSLKTSQVNKRFMQELQDKAPGVTVHSLYDVYADGVIDVEREQALLESHDRVVLQFPFYWYNAPSLLQKWKEQVLAFGWAYGPRGDRLKGKQIMVAVSTGGPAHSYQAGGYNNFSMSELLKPFQAMSNLVGCKYLSAFVFHGAAGASGEQIAAAAAEYAAYIQSPLG